MNITSNIYTMDLIGLLCMKEKMLEWRKSGTMDADAYTRSDIILNRLIALKQAEENSTAIHHKLFNDWTDLSRDVRELNCILQNDFSLLKLEGHLTKERLEKQLKEFTEKVDQAKDELHKIYTQTRLFVQYTIDNF
jgi:hypothetical protein